MVEFAFPTVEDEVCTLCKECMQMTNIGYGGDEVIMRWKCNCGAIKTTIIKAEEYDERYYCTCND